MQTDAPRKDTEVLEGMYPPLPPVEVGEWVRFEESGWPEVDYIRVDRMTAKLIYANGMRFSREHGAYFDVGVYDAYAGRIRKITKEDHSAIAALYAKGTLSEGQAARATGLDRVTLRKMADDLILSGAVAPAAQEGEKANG